MASRVRHGYQFGPYRLDASDRLLYKNADLIALPPKVFDTLLMLVTNHGHVVAKDEMLKQLWPDTFVEDGTLTQYISLLRKALGDDGSWVENLPRRGYRFTAAVEEFRDDLTECPADPGPPRPKPRLRPAQIALATAVLVIVTAGLAWWYYSPPAPIRSIAVLPFLNLSGDPKIDYISDGLSDELTHALARLHGVRVAARTSAFQFRGKNEDVRHIGRQLNVAGVLEGSVRLDRDRIRVTAQFIDARTGYHVWSETFEGGLNELMSIQQRIGTAIEQRLAREVPAQEVPVSEVTREVYLPYLRGPIFPCQGQARDLSQSRGIFQGRHLEGPQFRSSPFRARRHLLPLGPLGESRAQRSLRRGAHRCRAGARTG